MSKILITLLSNKIDIYASTHLINSLKSDNPQSEVSVLTFSDQLTYFSSHKNINEVYSIDRNFINGINQSALYSDAFALNNFFDSIDPCYAINWDKVINFSNDTVSSYINSMMNADEKIGTSISALGSATTSNIWSNYLNFVAPNIEEDIITPNIIRHYMCSIPYVREGSKVKLNNEFTQVATTNFSRIRQSLPTLQATYMVGVSLMPSFGGRYLCEESLTEFIETIETSENYRAVLIVSDSKEEKDIVNRLNEKFNNSLISINADRTAYPSVVLNLDFLVSANNEHLMIADTLETKVIEVRSEQDMKRRSSLVNSDNYVIYQADQSIANDLIILLNQESETELPITSMKSNNKIFMTAEDDYGFLMTQIRGEIDIQSEVRYHIERSYHFQMMGFAPDPKFIQNLRDNVNTNDLTEFISQSKDELTNTTKLLLATLRSLKGAKQSQGNLKNFIMYLDQIIIKAKSTSITRGAIGLFEGRIESINSENSEENMKLIESHLFSLKSDLQSLANLFSDLTSERARDTEVVNTL
jgi:ADP-heptose:LPS heptosyltransferase